jgi:tetratricopeptide (TPR) repeat protein
MNRSIALLVPALMLAFASTLAAQAEELFARTHSGAREPQVANNWFSELPTYIHRLTSTNQFPTTHLPMDINDRNPERPVAVPMRDGVNRFEIRDANRQQFRAFLMVRDGIDGNGLPVYKVTEKAVWIPWRSWPAKYIVETYPVESNTDAKDLVALAAWLYTNRENNLANRVLTVAHGLDPELASLIEGYICEKERWTRPDEGLVEFNLWDAEYRKERKILVTPERRDRLVAEREREADSAYKELLAARGDYRGRAPRRRSPSRPLIRLEYDFNQFKIAYQGTDFLKDERKQAEIEQIIESIADDRARIAEELATAESIEIAGKPNEAERKANMMEQILRIDPMDMHLRSKVAQAWMDWANPADHGNSADRVQGLRRAIPHWEELLKVYPQNTSFLIALGRCYQAQEDSTRARVYYERVIEIDGTGGHSNVARALIRNMELKDQNRQKGKGN